MSLGRRVIKLGYLHLETDAEFAKRILDGLGKAAMYWTHDLTNVKGEYLDAIVWDVWKKQRKLIEVYP